jgi:signal transduction histidine kinase
MGVLWLLFTASYISFFYVFELSGTMANAGVDGYIEVMLLSIPSVVLLGATLWLRESKTDGDLHPRMLGWTIGMAGLFVVAMYTALFVIETQFDPGEQWLILLFSTGFGASAGTALGGMDIRSKQRERHREATMAVARQRKRERNQLEYLNQYLRHEVLNEATKIITHTELVEMRTDQQFEHADSLETIRNSGNEIATFIESIRTILDASNHEPQLSSVDVSEILEQEVVECRNTFPDVEIECECGPTHALGGDLLNRVFRNLLENAIEHNGRDVSISISVSTEADWVTVTIADDGTGIQPEKRETLFDPPASGDHGYGLFLTRNLVELYGGRIELDETGSDGTTFIVRLPIDSPQAESVEVERIDSRAPQPDGTRD